MAVFSLSSSTWYSLGRLSSSRACMPWNSRSSPTGVVISMTLGMSVSTRRAHNQAGDGRARLHSQFRPDNVGPQPRLRDHPLDVGARVHIAAVMTDGVARGRGLAGLAGTFLEREDEHAARTKRRGSRRHHLLERAEIHQGVG